MLTSIDAEQLADAVLAEAQRHKPRTAERRAACHAWTALVTSPSLSAARSAIGTFGTPEIQAAALELLGRLNTTPTEGTPP